MSGSPRPDGRFVLRCRVIKPAPNDRPMWRSEMADRQDSDVALIGQVREGDEHALAELFNKHRKRLRRMVGLRLDRRLQGRIDPSDVLQEAFLDVYRRRAEYVVDHKMPPFLWLRFLTGQRLLAHPSQAPGRPDARGWARGLTASGRVSASRLDVTCKAAAGPLDDAQPGGGTRGDADQASGHLERDGPDRPRGAGPAAFRRASRTTRLPRFLVCKRPPRAIVTFVLSRD